MNRPFEIAASKVLASSLASLPSVLVVLEVDDGCVSSSGDFASGLPSEMIDLVLDAYEQSKSDPSGPWYRCEIAFTQKDGFAFRYFWLADALANLDSVPPSRIGGLPAVLLRARLDDKVLSKLEDYQVSDALISFVPASIQRGGPVNARLIQLYAVADWHGDSNNGSLNQYFSRSRDPYGGLDREPLYDATLRGLELIGYRKAADHFREAIATYSQFYDRVENARNRLGIEPLADPTRSQVVDEYWDVETQLDQFLVAYVRSHINELSVAQIDT